jgi:hypothetical protein
MSVSRKRFIGMSAAALPVLAACGRGSSGTSPVPNGDAGPVPAAPALPAGVPVADLRFGFSPTPAVFPGYDPAGDAKALIVAGTPSPATAPVPGTLATGSYAVHERYVIKVPQAWNGKLIVAGTPAFRSEFASDAIWGDFALAGGYAYASSNKVVQFNAIVETVAATPSPATFFPIPFDLESLETLKYGFRFGALTQTPRPLIGSWNVDFATLTVAAQAFLKKCFGKAPLRTYAVGLSNGGAQVRSLLEQYPSLVDGGVDWSGVFWSPSLNILTYRGGGRGDRCGRLSGRYRAGRQRRAPVAVVRVLRRSSVILFGSHDVRVRAAARSASRILDVTRGVHAERRERADAARNV